MSQKPLLTITILIAMVLVFSVLRGSLCEVHLRLGGAEFAAFLQCS
ncbi:Hok/Gef family protein [Salmonella enterica]|uniref:Hok/Gef family protein n=1 Tax=Salmonella enterica TaxID=28901 RepID=A0A5T2M651_SALER|nr:Hok/Gef family protein [Salmonella enterica]ATI90346.1 Hok/Gef family protein [Salmonella enterica subsp. enterica]EAA8033863.1 Hok/Gef family protein [Salmonella enterica subsp. enterica serovar Duisburg]ECH8182145.1 Hok/Gef family protein [Salmonella enterica subsp. enterica serovar Rissen]EEJ1458701.1 Hok/Gef family protein [Salmonella enterica subsp. enterica serovar Virginia]EEJ6872093.1 Hok/Gef family protein [Salmonella enterica subsp. houtenae]EGF6407993.1 Hok/Gef family protein [S